MNEDIGSPLDLSPKQTDKTTEDGTEKKIVCIYDLRLIFTVEYFVTSDNSDPDSLYSGFPIHSNV